MTDHNVGLDKTKSRQDRETCATCGVTNQKHKGMKHPFVHSGISMELVAG